MPKVIWLTEPQEHDYPVAAGYLALLAPDNPHVAADLHKINHERPLSPVLLVRGDLDTARALHIADGYHRICAAHHTDENSDIPCHLAADDTPAVPPELA